MKLLININFIYIIYFFPKIKKEKNEKIKK